MDTRDLLAPGGEIEFLKMLGDLPFSQSNFQNLEFQIKHLTEGRTRRQILLEINEKYKALKECEFRRRRLVIEKSKLQRKKKWSPFRSVRELAAIDLEEKNYAIVLENKLLQDALYDFEMYKHALEQTKPMTREEYEKEEKTYWRERMLKEARMQIIAGRISPGLSAGLLEQLEKIGVSPAMIADELNVPLTEYITPLLEDPKK